MRVLLILLFPLIASAEGSGKISLEGAGFAHELPEPVPRGEGRVDIQYDRDFRLGESWTFRFHPVARAVSSPGAWEKPAIVDPREVAVEWMPGSFFLRAGAFTPKWEGTDGVNPMDIASMKDWSDPLRTQTLASGGLQAGFSGESFDFEMFWVPWQTAPMIPWEKSAWWPRDLNLPVRSEDVQLRLVERVDYEILERQRLNDPLRNNGGLRLQLRGESMDFALAAFEGAADWPMLTPIVNVIPIYENGQEIFELRSPVTLQPIDFRRRTGAGYLSWAWGTTIVRASMRHDQPLGEDRRLPGWSSQGVLGVENNFAVGANNVTVVLQGTWGRRADGGGVLSVSDLFDRAVLWGLRWPVGESWNFMLSGFVSTRDQSRFSQLEISRRWNDHWSTDFFVQELGGPEGSLPAVLADRDRAGLRMTRAF